MLDGHFKEHQDRFWDRLGRGLAKTGLSANQVTLLGVFAVLANCAAYPWHKSSLAFGLLLLGGELLDNLDGAVARVTGTSSRFGAYLDATTDRYKEAATLGVIGYVHDEWLLCFLCLAGALITSYNKARAGMEIPISNTDWPDLFERFERLALLITLLVLNSFVDPSHLAGRSLLGWGLGVLAALTWLSSLQRLWRARTLLLAHPEGGREAGRQAGESSPSDAGVESGAVAPSELPGDKSL